MGLFTCAKPEKAEWHRQQKRHIHPRPWQLKVQSHLRGLKVPTGTSEGVWIGRDDSGIAAIAHCGFDDTAQQLMIWAIARATRCRGQRYGLQALDYTMMSLLLTKEEEGLDCGAFGRVHPDNEGSKELLRQHGWQFLSMGPGGLETWFHGLDLTP